MNRVVLDRSLRERLDDLSTQCEFCDEQGNVVGYFVPATERENLLYAWAQGEFTEDEISRARLESGGQTTADVLKSLGSS